ncbi:auxin efflux carrier [Dendryphion nanum]|uniref:Auxin efflux carrier n=1 Tax=Dendryphion nanum TaxID=256645 RepID=A0A9P9IPD3_9PLEO|nr:auxin efflux carrier [Dendryphion nanum]
MLRALSPINSIPSPNSQSHCHSNSSPSYPQSFPIPSLRAPTPFTMSTSGILPSFLAAIQASLSVLLVISYGALAAKYTLLSPSNAKAISKICVKMFLPLLLLVQIGSQLHLHSAHRYLLILAWAFLCHAVSFGIGIAGHVWFGFPDWITAAIMFNNTTSYPLLLIQSLEQTGILGGLVGGKTKEGIERAKSYFLVFATVSSCLTFAVGPRLMDAEHEVEADDRKSLGSSLDGGLDSDSDAENDDENGVGGDGDVENGVNQGQVTETTHLLVPSQSSGRGRHHSVVSITFFPSTPKFASVPRRPFYIARPHWKNFSPRTQWWLLFFYDFLNAPLLGAVLGAVIGLTPPLHRAFFADTYSGGIFTAWLTESWRNVGGLFVPLPLIVAGISLWTSYHESKAPSSPSSSSTSAPLPWTTTLFILIIRFLLWPILSIGTIYFLVHSEGRDGILGDDPMLWFAMMLMPTGPPAMKLITMVQVSDAGIEDERKIARILTVSYIISPVLAFTVVGALRASLGALG